MKARTLIITVGATVALVGATVQPAGAKVASKCTVVSAKRVLVVGNGTKAPYYVLANGAKAPLSVGYTGSGWRYPQSTTGKSCGTSKPQKPLVKKHVTDVTPTPVVVPAIQPEPHPVTIGSCELTTQPADAGYPYVALGECLVPVPAADVSAPAPQADQTAASTNQAATDTAGSTAADQAAIAATTDPGNPYS